MPEAFNTLKGKAVPLLRDNIDTDTISPGTQTPRKKSGTQFGEKGSTTLADDLFANWRYDLDGEPKADFVLNQTKYAGARILLTGANFGCGSSRESAVWMLSAWGIRCIVAPSFAEIFSSNCYANGLLPITLPADTITQWAVAAQEHPQGKFQVDLESCEIIDPCGMIVPFSISKFRREGLLHGLDEIALTLREVESIRRFAAHGREHRPWVYGFAPPVGP